MPLVAQMNQMVREPMEMVMEEIELEGLTKLVAKGHRIGLSFGSPDIEKKSKEEKDNEMQRWRDSVNLEGRAFVEPYPVHKYLSTVWVSGRLVTLESKKPKFLQVYTPIRFMIPVPETDETLRGLKDRIEEDSTRVVEEIRKSSNGGEVNAYYLGNLELDYVLENTHKQNMPIAGERFLSNLARNVLIPRYVFDLCLFNIKGE